MGIKDRAHWLFNQQVIRQVLATNELLIIDGPSKLSLSKGYTYNSKLDTDCKNCKAALEYVPSREPITEGKLTCPVCESKQWESIIQVSLN